MHTVRSCKSSCTWVSRSVNLANVGYATLNWHSDRFCQLIDREQLYKYQRLQHIEDDFWIKNVQRNGSMISVACSYVCVCVCSSILHAHLHHDLSELCAHRTQTHTQHITNNMYGSQNAFARAQHCTSMIVSQCLLGI